MRDGYVNKMLMSHAASKGCLMEYIAAYETLTHSRNISTFFCASSRPYALPCSQGSQPASRLHAAKAATRLASNILVMFFLHYQQF